MISKNKIKLRARKKTNPETAETILSASKHPAWKAIAQKISGSTRHYASVNLSTIEKNTTAGDTVVIPGKILSQGSITKKVRICALGISELAREKLKATKSEYVSILEEIKKNAKAEGIKVLK